MASSTLLACGTELFVSSGNNEHDERYSHQVFAVECVTSHSWATWYSWGEQQGQGSVVGSRQLTHAEKHVRPGTSNTNKCVHVRVQALGAEVSLSDQRSNHS